jgi:hypothetical protein
LSGHFLAPFIIKTASFEKSPAGLIGRNAWRIPFPMGLCGRIALSSPVYDDWKNTPVILNVLLDISSTIIFYALGDVFPSVKQEQNRPAAAPNVEVVVEEAVQTLFFRLGIG